MLGKRVERKVEAGEEEVAQESKAVKVKGGGNAVEGGEGDGGLRGEKNG